MREKVCSGLTVPLFWWNICRRTFHWQSKSSQKWFQLYQVWIFSTKYAGGQMTKTKSIWSLTTAWIELNGHLQWKLTVGCRSVSVNKELPLKHCGWCTFAWTAKTYWWKLTANESFESSRKTKINTHIGDWDLPIFTSNSKPKSRIWQGLTADTHLKDLHEGEKTVLKRPLVVAVENKWLQQLQNGEYVAEEGHVILLSKLPQI